MHKSFISQILKKFEALPNNPMREATPERMAVIINGYFETLHDLPEDMLQAAASAYLAIGQFFPTPGNLRAKAVDIALLTMGVPTPAEAWAQVIGGIRITKTIRCEIGNQLRDAIDGKANGEYWDALHKYSQHVDGCPDCYESDQNNWHPAVQQAYDNMGGEHAIFTDNPSADRARFLEGYRAFVEREILRFSMPAGVRGYIAENSASMAMRQLATDMRPRLIHPDTREVLE